MRPPSIHAAVLAIAVVMQLPLPSVAQTPQIAREEAQRSLVTLEKLATTQTYRGLGFNSLEEVKSAALGTPVQVFMVGLAALRDYQPGIDPNRLLEDTHEIIYPIVVAGQQRSSVTLHQVDGQWRVASFGSATLTNALVEMRQQQVESTRTPIEALFAVTIPALNLHFVGRRADNTLLLTPLFSDPWRNLEKGRTLEGQAVFNTLAPHARELETGPNTAN